MPWRLSDMRKYDIVNALIATNGYTRYLEICTPTTGFHFSRIRRIHCRHRLIYRCRPGFRDGSEITLRSADDQINHLLDPALPYDLIFLDSYHTFECSLRDLESALALLRPGGAIVVHDCAPTRKEFASASFRPGAWCGHTYCAYIEFVLSHPDLVHYTVDADCGCGVIKKTAPDQLCTSHSDSELARLWRLQRSRQQDMFDFFHQHRRQLLNLISVREFLSREKGERPRFSRLTQWRDTVAALLQT